MGRPRKFKSPAQLLEKWEEYKELCDNQVIPLEQYDSKKGEYVFGESKKKITYTLEGFALYVKLPRQDFYATYDADPKFSPVLSLMREECEVDARRKFELGVINPKLAGLWMSKYGYSNKLDTGIQANVHNDNPFAGMTTDELRKVLDEEC